MRAARYQGLHADQGFALHVLLVEDDADLATAMRGFLGARGFVVSQAANLAEARRLLPLSQWGVVLLDLHLPDGDGIDLLPAIKRHGSEAATLILTARDQVSDRIRGLDAGADDYLVKPFDPDELLARLRAVERRRHGSQSSVVTIGKLTIDLAQSRVSAGGPPIDLTAKEWAVLRVMATRPERIHTREILTDALYGFDSESDSNTLEVFISHLRRKLGKDAIQTLRGLGYRLTGGAT